jgi:adenylosuccinate synthase
VKVVAVLGGQWGDEGKGKIVDLLSDRFDVVARYHGGHNAGHTVKFGERHFALHLLPSGIVRGRLGVIGPGVVVDPEALLSEIEAVESEGIRVSGKLLLSDRAQVILTIGFSTPHGRKPRETPRSGRRCEESVRHTSLRPRARE